jgi:nickel-dependent lactate racemase
MAPIKIEGSAGMQIVKVPQLAWYGARDFDMPLPDDWQVEMCYMAGYKRPELKPEEIRQALRNPIGTQPLRALARGKKSAVIVFDDLTRVTQSAKIVPHVLEELTAAGIAEDNIRFICGLALHGVMYRSDFVRKLGEDVVSRFRVFNHNAFGNCVYVGTTSKFKTKLYINEEYMKCDLKIVIGSCVPHPIAGYGGGSKLVMPGLASFESIKWHHTAGGARMDPVDLGSKPTQGMGFIDQNRFKQDIDECAELAGIDFLINTITNLWGENAGIFAGDWKQAFSAAVKEARVHYRTPKSEDNDIVIANSYAKVSESMVSLAAGIPLVSQKGGDLVVIANAPEGQVTHYLVGIFGKATYACLYTQCTIPPNVKNIISFTEYPHRGSSWFEEHEKIIYMSKWEEVLKTLQDKHKAGTRVAVIADATNQYFAWYD